MVQLSSILCVTILGLIKPLRLDMQRFPSSGFYKQASNELLSQQIVLEMNL